MTLSVVMPTFNYARFLPEALDSILAQTFRDWELVIVDDASTDGTERVCRNYADRDPRIRYVRRSLNGGTGAALNDGFSLVSGGLETWWASDNVLYSNAWEELVHFLHLHPDVDHVYANNDIGIMDETGLLELRRVNLWDEVDQTWDPIRLSRGYFLGCVWAWRRALRETIGPFQPEPCEDYDFALRAVEAGFRFAHHNVCLGWFRRHPANVTATRAKPEGRTLFVHEKARLRRSLAS